MVFVFCAVITVGVCSFARFLANSIFSLLTIISIQHIELVLLLNVPNPSIYFKMYSNNLL